MIKTKLEDIKSIHSELASQLNVILALLKDTTIDLDERWSVYTDLVTADILTRDELYGDGQIDTLGDFTLYDDFYVERYETKKFIDMLEVIDEKLDDELITQENFVLWKEKILSNGYASFKYDW